MKSLKYAGLKIKEIRKKRGDTLEDLGKKTGFNYSNLSKVERGIRNPTIELIEKVSEVYDVKISYFLGEEQEVPIELKDKVKWIAFGEEMEKRNLTPEELRTIVDIVNKLK